MWGCGAQKTALNRFTTDGGQTFGYKDASGKTVVPPGVYSELPGKSSSAVVVMDNGATDGEHQWVLLNTAGRKTAVVYANNGIPDVFHSGRIRVTGPGGETGFAGTDGDVVILPQYKYAMPFAGEYAAVAVYDGQSMATQATDTDTEKNALTGNERWGVIDRQGKTVKKAEYTRKWDSKLGTYIYVSPTNTFWITDRGEIKGY